MAAPGTIAHVTEVAQQLAAAVAEHADSLLVTAAGATTPGPAAVATAAVP